MDAIHLQLGMRCVASDMIRWLGICLAVVVRLHLSGAEASGASKLRVLTSLVPIYSWTASIAGDFAVVENLLPADVGPHDFQFRPRDLKKVQAADLIIINGLGVESWLERTFQNTAGDRKDRVLRTTDGLKSEFIYHLPELHLDATGTRSGHSHEHDHAAAGEPPNPHLWLDPVYARHAVSNILTALCSRDPAHAAAYQKNAAGYLAQLEQLDRDFQILSARLKRKSIVTYHDAFPYFVRRYGFELVGVVEEIPSVSPSPKYLSELSKVIKDRDVRVIFTEPQFEPRLVRQLTRDLGITFAELNVLETGPLQADFYVQGMRRNLRTLSEALK